MAESVGLGIQPVDAFGKLSQLLQLKQQQQALRSATAEAQMQEQEARQRAALASYDFGRHIGQDGVIDLESLNNPELRFAAGNQYLDIVGKAVAAREAQLQTKRTMMGLTGDRIEALGKIAGALISDPDVADDKEGKGIQKVNDALRQYAELYGDDVLPVIAAYAPQLKAIQPGKLPQALRTMQLQAMDVVQQKAAQAPEYVARGGSVVNVNPMVGAGVPQEIAMTLPPGAQILTDVAGRQFVLDPQTNRVAPVGVGRSGATQPSPVSRPKPQPPSAAPSSSTFQQPAYQGQAEDVAKNQAMVETVRTAADKAGYSRNVNQQILALSKDARTGPGTPAWQKFIASVSAPFGLSPNANYQELGKMLEKNALANMQEMGGPPSDARLEAAAAANGSVEFNPEALQAVTKFNDATTSGLAAYRSAMDKAVGTKTPDYTNLPDFRSAWAENFDIDIFRHKNAMRDGDQAEIAKIAADLTPARAAELRKKAANLRKLTETGKL